ncbi:MAG: hypothetical protein RIF41_06855, partial [Polyangiaceae bacterium]
MSRPDSTSDIAPIIAGLIAAESDPPGLSRERWLALVQSSDRLRPLDDEGAAEIVQGDRVIGKMSWSTTANEIDVYGEPDAVADAAWDVAAALG